MFIDEARGKRDRKIKKKKEKVEGLFKLWEELCWGKPRAYINWRWRLKDKAIQTAFTFGCSIIISLFTNFSHQI